MEIYTQNDSKGDGAITIFMENIVSGAYDGTISAIKKWLEEGPSGRLKNEDFSSIHNWFNNLNENDKNMVNHIIEKSVNLAIFSFLVTLDNKKGGTPLKGQLSDFALYLQTYNDKDSMINYQFNEARRINLSNTIDGELHDRFSNILHKRNDLR